VICVETHDGRALVLIPKRSASPRATSTPQRKVFDPEWPIREAHIASTPRYVS
jgi:hypothetical protein